LLENSLRIINCNVTDISLLRHTDKIAPNITG